ncbi:MAG: hypothetical protein MUF73_14150 [Rhodobacteraceae bacterium]|jgi:hypothetical protein|nr:hypothetical protein [Paracoccaceae bacterium]
MIKHRGFPGRYPSSDHQFVIRRANAKGATPIVRRERYADRATADRRVDAAFLAALFRHFGTDPFPRGNLDAGRLSWLIGREVVAVGRFDPADYDQLLVVDLTRARLSFPEVFAADAPDDPWPVDSQDDDDDDGDTPDGPRPPRGRGRSA